MKIRNATGEDLPGLQKLQRRSHRSVWDRSTWREEFAREQGIIWVVDALEHGEIAGFLVAWRVLDSMEIVDIAVDPLHRRQGIASALIEMLAAVAGSNGVDKIALEVRENNLAALSMYKKLGFQQLGRRSDFYDDGEAASVMVFDLVDG